MKYLDFILWCEISFSFMGLFRFLNKETYYNIKKISQQKVVYYFLLVIFPCYLKVDTIDWLSLFIWTQKMD
jgi:diacylglycerol kinase